MKKLIEGIAVKKILTEAEIKKMKLLGVVKDEDWETAVLTGSTAYGNSKEDSDLDIFFYGCRRPLNKYSGRFGNKTPKGWKDKKANNFDKDYPETCLNVVSGRLNVFSLTDGYYQMYKDATKICLENGNRDNFIAFIKLAMNEEWYY